MNFQDAIIITEVMKTRNISKAAENLFLAQSTVSTRIKQVERELNCELFYRGKGQRQLEITAAGKEFMQIARHIKTANDQINLLKENNVQELRLASNQNFYYEVLQPYSIQYMKENPQIRLSIQVKDSTEVYQLMKDEFADLGYASFDSGSVGLITEPVYKQRWCVISGAELPNTDGVIKADCLRKENECFFNAGDLECIYRWRLQYLNSTFAGRIQTNSFIESLEFIREFKCWEFASEEWAKKMHPLGQYHIYQLETPPESRVLYQIRQNQNYTRPVVNEFAKGFVQWMKESFSENQLF